MRHRSPSSVKAKCAGGARVAGDMDRLSEPRKEYCAVPATIAVTLTVVTRDWGLGLSGSGPSPPPASGQTNQKRLKEFFFPCQAYRSFVRVPFIVARPRRTRRAARTAARSLHYVLGERRSDLLLAGEIVVAHALDAVAARTAAE